MSEFSAAQQLGATLGRREIEQQADAYRMRAERELNSDLPAALRDAKTARSLYDRIPGFDQADEHRSDLNAIHAPVIRNGKQRRARRWR